VLVAIDDVQWLDAGSIEGAGVSRCGGSPAGRWACLLAVRTEAPADPLTIDAPAAPG